MRKERRIRETTQGRRTDPSVLPSPPTTAPRVPCSTLFSAPADRGAEPNSVTSDVTSLKSEVTSEVTPEPGSDSTPLGFWSARLVFGRDHGGGALHEENLS